MLNLRYQDLGQVRIMDKRQHGHCFLSAHFAELSWALAKSTGAGTIMTSANWGQIIGINLFLLQLLAIIGNYWLLLAIIGIIGLQKVLLLLAIIGLHPYH